ncbi:MAG: M57 family metalloprotease [Chitinophagaceae bacterium]
MKKRLPLYAWLMILSLGLGSCQKMASVQQNDTTISADILSKIQALGFGTSSVVKVDDGYLVEGDIVLTDELLNSAPARQLLRVGAEEQYRTTNLVSRLPRTLTVRVDASLSSLYVVAIDSMIQRFNKLKLQLTFQRVSSGGDIVLRAAPQSAQYLASSGFPTTSGSPYGQVLVSRRYLDSWKMVTIVSVLAHEVGHCIGFRHTDYMSRQYSCGGSSVNEGASTVGAILIPGTPSSPDAGSWMLACLNDGYNRPFNANDIIALNYLY